MGTHAELLARHQAVLPSWLALYYDEPIALVRGDGRRVWDAEGREYLDLFGGILTTMTAHALPEVVEAVQAQAARMLHTSTLYLIERRSSSPRRSPGSRRCPTPRCSSPRRAPRPTRPRCCSPAPARRSQQVLAMRNSYHGRSFATMAITGNRGWSASALSPVDVKYVHGGYRLRSPFGHLDDAAFTQGVRRRPARRLVTQTAGDVACLVAEPIQGVGGFTVPPDGFFGAMKEVSTSTASSTSATRSRPAGGAPESTSGGSRRTASNPTS
jgi:4-aminobutyrate aminotransferase